MNGSGVNKRILLTIVLTFIVKTNGIIQSTSPRLSGDDSFQKGDEKLQLERTESKTSKKQDVSLRPNFIILLLDDHGYGDVGIYDNTTTETPHIDQLGKSGIQFLDYHSGGSVCAPSRAALLTGRLGLRTGVKRNFGPMALGGLPVEEFIISELLPSQYKKHMIGKWHLGHKEPYHPSFRGFDTFYGLPYSGDMGCLDMTPQSCKPGVDRSTHTSACPSLCHLDGSRVGIPLYDAPAANCTANAHNRSDDDNNNSNNKIDDENSNKVLESNEDDHYKICDATITEQPVNEFTLNHRYAERAEDIITKAATLENTSPFLLYIGFAHTHQPMAYESDKWSNSSKRPGWKRHYGNTLAEVDDAIGRIIQTLHRYEEMANNTIVFLTSDNGPADVAKFDCDFIGSPGPYNGLWQKSASGGGGGGTMKRTVWEGGHRVLFLASWQGTIRPGRVSSKNDIISSFDILPTILSLANGNNTLLPRDRVYDGMDISGILKDETMTLSELLKNNMDSIERLENTDKQSTDNGGSDTSSGSKGGSNTEMGHVTAIAKGGLIIGDNNDVIAIDLGDYSCNDDNGNNEKDGSTYNMNGREIDCRKLYRVLFHPNMTGFFDAMRIGRYKLFFRTGDDTGSCNGHNPGRIIDHMPPLVFDLLNDPAESRPLPASDLPPRLINMAIAARKWKMNNIQSTLCHKANMKDGTNKQDSAPCCNRDSEVCRCPWQEKELTQEQQIAKFKG